MLAKENRINTPADFRSTLRKGRRKTTEHFVVSLVKNDTGVTRFGFIVTTKMGNAVQRNLVKRRLREVAAAVIAEGTLGGADVVVRALPSAAETTFTQVQTEVTKALTRAGK